MCRPWRAGVGKSIIISGHVLKHVCAALSSLHPLQCKEKDVMIDLCAINPIRGKWLRQEGVRLFFFIDTNITVAA